ncbi:arabinose efflux permease family protein [Desulfitobacterium dehalogenans ATCC 51507]|uniref:Arabinose efflux permease family protein n=1 Tax=Desulfitobacterium dehalogenans (strain ATCC 51507 / DSM 9161 / JW/IU-DC1) TaxID=756499 RepID=I4A8X6_DESDJ|nr:MDR family MFS transporter [Desulfitobacterium dehalogenans]AFM00411.1 arabinose efflux permease family protein [Desulfitobacterium dehalogenans ATCC 51507]
MDTAQKSNRSLVLTCIMLATFMSAIEGTIVATAMPSIVADLGGFSSFSWVFSAFLLSQAITIPIYGKLADLYGRKPIFFIGVIIFLIGSVLCGFATTMNSLILFRLIQGVGAGAVQPISATIVGDIFAAHERAKVQGYISGVWGVASVIGPALGAVFVQYIHWAWVFWVNIPIGIISMAGIYFFFHESVKKQSHDIDYAGSGLIFLAVSALMFILIQGGVVWPWVSWQVGGLLAFILVVLILFIRQEERAKEPVMPLGLWKDRLITLSNLATLTTGMLMIGVSTFVPTFVQGVMGQPPIIAGFALTAMSIGWTVAAALVGLIMVKVGFRPTAISGGVFLLAGSILYLIIQPQMGWLWVAAGSFTVGIGMGLTRTVFIVAIQNSVHWEMRGVATATNMFMSILGNTLGAGLLAGILNGRLLNYLNLRAADINIPVSIDLVNTILDPQRMATIPTHITAIVKEGLASSLHYVFGCILLMAIISTVLLIFLPAERRGEAE